MPEGRRPAAAAGSAQPTAWFNRETTVLVSPASAPYIVSMCNDYEQHVRWAKYCKMMQVLEIGFPAQQSELDLPQTDDIRMPSTVLR